MRYRRYLDQIQTWPNSGRHILAQFDSDSVYVYQAYRPSIAEYAVKHQQFGGEFSYSRMSWIKPNFLWMMYRAGWAAKEGQERILTIRLRRTFFDEMLRRSIASSFDPQRYIDRETWQAAVTASEVRLQWDPDHDPTGRAIERRAVQLGIRGNTLRRYGREELLSVEDITPFVIEQCSHLGNGFSRLVTPEEQVYFPTDEGARLAAGIERASL